MNKIESFITAVIAVCICTAFIGLAVTTTQPPPYRSCIVASTNVTLIPAVPNSITILRNGKREVCYVYKDTKHSEKENELSNK